ncbi:MAG: hypothetical protein OEV55_03620 [candidate division Zixibacteria bacterium]|nr:hypothetical protein [candidate division Zixibacteria bacterium]
MLKKDLYILTIILLLVLACENPFSPPVIGPGTEIPIASQTDPDSVLKNFKYSYEYRDIVTYENCLHKEFEFFYIDQDEVTGELIEDRIHREDDINRTKGVLAAFDDIRFEAWEVFHLLSEYDSTSAEEIKLRQVIFHLVLIDIDGDFGYEYLDVTGFALFKFKRSEDGYWRMSYWEDNSIQDY